MKKSPEQKAVIILIWGTILLVIGYFSSSIVGNIKKIAERESDNTSQQELIKQVLSSAPRRGNVNAPLLLVEFGDFECPVCKEVSPIIKNALRNHADDFQQIWVHAINTELHPNSLAAATASECASKQGKFWEFHDALFENQEELSPALYQQIGVAIGLNIPSFQECLKDPATKEIIDAHRSFTSLAEVTETPYLSLNSAILSGSFTAEELESFIQSQL